MADYRIRTCTPEDAATIARHRAAMFVEMGVVPSDELARQLRAASEPALLAAIRAASYVGWLATSGADAVIAGVGVHLKPNLPRIAEDGTCVAVTDTPLVVNVYTEPDWRQRGVARTLMKTAMDWCIARGFDRMLLHASDAGRPLYASLGFVASNEMRWAAPPGGSHDAFS
jgi:GNAT superfamily N-acetyltransferase